MQHVRVPGMLHGRVVRPRGQGAYGAGAKVMALDETSIANIPGARVLRKGDFVGVVAENEWDAVRAARQLKVHVGFDAVADRQRPACTKPCAPPKPTTAPCWSVATPRMPSERLRTRWPTTAALLIRPTLLSDPTARSPM